MPSVASAFCHPRAPCRRGAMQFNIAAHDKQPAKSKKKALLIGVTYELQEEEQLASQINVEKSDKSSLGTSSDNGEKRAVIDGVLKGPHHDVIRMRRLLMKQYGYTKDNITLMIDKKDHPAELLPTRDNIISNIMQLVKDAQPGDQFFFHFAGHSTQGDCKDPAEEEEDGQDEYICAMYEQDIMDNELKELLVDPLPFGAKLTALFDCCHSATILDLPHTHCNQTSQILNSSVLPAIGQVNLLEGPDNSLGPGPRARSSTRKQLPQLDSSSLSSLPYLRISSPRTEKAEKMNISIKTDYTTEVSPMKECMSPQSTLKCDGMCSKSDPRASYRGPTVICLSAAKDSQFSWEMNKYSTTQFLINLLRENPHPDLQNLLNCISNKVHNLCSVMQDRRKNWKLKNPNRPCPSRYNTKDLQQDPQISSLEVLNMNAMRWDP
ncbi:caspase domain-containing protein [Cyathus striatus]|nr:caspase domain-containing protein [Cyathus striatus]